MTPRLKTRTLSQTVFSTLLVFSLLVVAAFVVLASLVLYNSYESDAEKTLTTKAEAVASALTGEDQDAQVQVMRQQIGGLVRYTYVAGDGTVLYDSEATGALENHADRPEIKAAQTVGEAVSSRYSQTLKNDLIYAAVRLDDGATIRLAQVRRSYAAYMGGLAVPLAALFAIVIIADFAVARRLTRRIMQPINAIDVDDPLSNEIYEEVSPLLVHIDDQRARWQR